MEKTVTIDLNKYDELLKNQWVFESNKDFLVVTSSGYNSGTIYSLKGRDEIFVDLKEEIKKKDVEINEKKSECSRREREKLDLKSSNEKLERENNNLREEINRLTLKSCMEFRKWRRWKNGK